ncbi:TetR/AcrR family transcriptional regulator [Frondihabitans cladoniiphilus]|uniref:TetR/AcrR family transcriptional regulator n=1 Tax=Frondihabitans cladoniiphilus TaxID=715785 RepID=A0ABP8VMK9_9MICO
MSGLVQIDETPRLGRKRDPSRDAEIQRCAVEVLGEVGYEGMTIEMVAARAKAGKATVYRRWASKEDLVIDSVACMKRGDLENLPLPDTGTLRGDLVALIRPHSIEDNEKKMRVMGGLMSLLSRNPELSDAVNSAIVEPRAKINRVLFQRAIDRGEIAPECDLDTLSMISPSMVAYRTLIVKKPVDREYLVSIIDGVILPAVGLRPGTA